MPYLFSSVLLLSFLSVPSQAQIEGKWSEGEHLELGDVGALYACYDLGIDKKTCPIKGILRQDGEISFTYGELVAAADFYNTPEELNLDENTGITQIIKCAHNMLHKKSLGNPNPKTVPECDIPALFFMPGHLEVASQNYHHFGWNNMIAYTHYHELALQSAHKSYAEKKKNPQKSKQLLDLAIIYNGFADHYLTDAFPAGHLRVARTQIKEWARDHLPGIFRGTRGDVLAIILHDNESRKVKTGEEVGLKVSNARGDTWLTRGDQHLHIDSNPKDPVYSLPLNALRESYREVLTTALYGSQPEGIFSAAMYVPFYQGISLGEKYSAQFQEMKKKDLLSALYASLPFFGRYLFSKTDFERMLGAVDEIYAQFRNQIRVDIREQPELSRRLPKPYLNAFEKVD